MRRPTLNVASTTIKNCYNSCCVSWSSQFVTQIIVLETSLTLSGCRSIHLRRNRSHSIDANSLETWNDFVHILSIAKTSTGNVASVMSDSHKLQEMNFKFGSIFKCLHSMCLNQPKVDRTTSGNNHCQCVEHTCRLRTSPIPKGMSQYEELPCFLQEIGRSDRISHTCLFHVHSPSHSRIHVLYTRSLRFPNRLFP
eukprot:Gregarina_sp_Poly_1__4064@NODE_2232_length_2435_cov_7_826014_g1434_i0_p2_GENE_NODE_2232_length_2435_cov_7_826014_g1434_i0NODE_2232_length_2435_cov_7_826014_g1434_i0_p2_ORF_typecomplete_len196_score9_08ImpYgjV/PF10688_9/0_17_NODE_2232_length_2435_cov_7_826014_g1434_i09721559